MQSKDAKAPHECKWEGVKITSVNVENINELDHGFIDPDFPHDHSSLGEQFENQEVQWIRVGNLNG